MGRPRHATSKNIHADVSLKSKQYRHESLNRSVLAAPDGLFVGTSAVLLRAERYGRCHQWHKNMIGNPFAGDAPKGEGDQC